MPPNAAPVEAKDKRIPNPDPVLNGPVINGLLWIGDQHLTSKPPQRRLDNYANAVLRKIERAIAIANERRLLPLLGGDLFDSFLEPDESLKTRLIKILRSSWVPPIANTGNHDTRKGAFLAVGDSLALIGETGVIHLMAQPGLAGIWRLAMSQDGTEHATIRICAVPYGYPLPDSLEDYAEADQTFLLSHHDLDFPGSYHDAPLMKPIRGCDIVLNGHLHKRFPPVTKGGTQYCNFGSIARTSIDCKDHAPCAVELGHDSIEDHELPHMPGNEAFDLEGYQVAAASPRAAAAAEMAQAHGSAFVDLMKQDMAAGRATASGAKIEERIEQVLAASALSKPAKALIISHFRQVTQGDDGSLEMEALREQAGRDGLQAMLKRSEEEAAAKKAAAEAKAEVKPTAKRNSAKATLPLFAP